MVRVDRVGDLDEPLVPVTGRAPSAAEPGLPLPRATADHGSDGVQNAVAALLDRAIESLMEALDTVRDYIRGEHLVYGLLLLLAVHLVVRRRRRRQVLAQAQQQSSGGAAAADDGGSGEESYSGSDDSSFEDQDQDDVEDSGDEVAPRSGGARW